MTRTIESERDWRAYFSSVADRAEPGEFLRQVGRTVGGQPITEHQVALEIATAKSELKLNRADCLLDLCCGNGLMTHRLASSCGVTFGVDFSKYLIEIARRYHAGNGVKYVHCPVTELTATHLNNQRPTKVCMLGGLQHFTTAKLGELLSTIRNLTGTAVPWFFSDVPDVNRLFDFYNTEERRIDYERRKALGTEAIGTWWSGEHLHEVFTAQNYTVEIRRQAPDRSGAHYRFDLLARPI